MLNQCPKHVLRGQQGTVMTDWNVPLGLRFLYMYEIMMVAATATKAKIAAGIVFNFFSPFKSGTATETGRLVFSRGAVIAHEQLRGPQGWRLFAFFFSDLVVESPARKDLD